ncbi:sensor domain-containing protein [Caballeronia mineralivorans]|uniref:sensor domain-containing protein n=1 Tax=Caballeronia mineralivorans TaxID=2010198 RepID=UPI0009E6236A|nr:bifunctional diguanylate cyclase/phosphodiesterase [Caballeronia mineralivorans]
MNSFFSRRLLVNLAVVLVAMGANAFIAYEQIDLQSDADARTRRSLSLMRDLDAYRSALGEILPEISWYEASGVLKPADVREARAAHINALESGLRAQFAYEPGMEGAFYLLGESARIAKRDAQAAFERAAVDTPGAARDWTRQAVRRLAEDLLSLDVELAVLRAREADSLAATLNESARASSRAVFLLILTMLAGGGALIYTFASHEKSARDKLRIARAMQRSNERFRDLFDAHPVPMWIVDAATYRFVAVNPAALAHYGYNELEFLSMTVRDLHADDDFDRLAALLARYTSDQPRQTGQTSAQRRAGVWRHKRRDGEQVSADISSHALTYSGYPGIFMLANDVTDRINAEIEARRSKQMLELLIDNIPQRIFWKDRESRYLGCNSAFARDAGLASKEQVVGMTDDALPWAHSAAELRDGDCQVIATGQPLMNQERDIHRNGEVRTSITSKLPLLDGAGRIIGVLGSYDDTTERKRAELALRLQSRALDACVNAVLITGTTATGNVIEYANPAFKRITGYDPADIVGRDCRFLQRDDLDQEGLKAIREGLAANREVSAVLRNYRKDGVLFWNQLFIAPVPDAHGHTTHHIGVINDVTEVIRYQEQLEYQANYDTLTRLPNRNLLRNRLQHAIDRARQQDTTVAVVFVDLDGFKNVNDSLGHSVGDRLLAVVAERLARCGRSGDTIGRHGGDEFVVVLPDMTGESALIAWMERVRTAISDPVWLDGTEMYVGCSMGASLFPQDGDDAETVLKKADLAMYRAKDMGRNTYQFYQPEMNASVGARMDVERRLRRALRDGEFLLHYQPQVDLTTGEIVGMEALVRWMDPEFGLVLPTAFIPVAEECGLIGPLSEWVLREACRQNKAWQDQGLPAARMSVNLSARQFQQRDIRVLVTSVLEETGLAPQYLEIELTESAIMRNGEEAVTTLSELAALGISIAIDDFGTGYSSLSYLKRFPVHRLKIDRSFVADIGSSGGNETITSAIIALAHSLELRVIAEGVETAAQLDFLVARACDEMQGFFFSQPLPGGDIPALLLNSGTSRWLGPRESQSDQSSAGSARGRRSLSVAT